jgi:phosphomannomutase
VDRSRTRPRFGYEEAIGYCVDPEAVPDKDGITALIRVLTLAAELKAAGLTLADRLDEIAERYGVYETDQLSVRVDDLGLIAAAMTRLRAQPPAALAGQPGLGRRPGHRQSRPAAHRTAS